MQPGDVVETVGGKDVANPHELAQTVADIKPGTDTEHHGAA